MKQVQHSKRTYLPFGMSLLVALLALTLFASEAFAFKSAEFAIREICGHMHGHLGALLLSAAGVGALTAAAFGNYKTMASLLVVAIGASTTSAVLSLYFEKAAAECKKSEKKIDHREIPGEFVSLGGNEGGGARVLGNLQANNAVNDPLAAQKAAIAIAIGQSPSKAPNRAYAPSLQGSTNSTSSPYSGQDEGLAELADTF